MNDDLEKSLRDLPRARPSADLDRRMATLFVGAVEPVPAARLRWWVLLGLPAAGLAAALLVFSLRPAPPVPARPAERIVYRIEPHGLMCEMLVPPARPPAAPVVAAAVRL